MTEPLTWVLQANAIKTADLDAIRAHLSTLDVRVEMLRVVPFSHEPADAVPTITGPCLVYGFGGLLALARREGWAPGGWDGDVFSSQSVIAQYGEDALNFDAISTTWGEAHQVASARGWNEVFTRPNSESKEFAGAVHTIDGLATFVEGLRSCGYLDDRNEPMIVAPVRTITREWRIFVVNATLVSASQYVFFGEHLIEPGAPAHVLAFAQDAIERFSPAPAFVLDIAEVEEDDRTTLKVIELNSISSSGFYAADKGAILSALTTFTNDCFR